MLEVFALKWLTGVLAGVLTDSLKERLKPASGGEKARDRGYALFESLRDLERATNRFVEALVAYGDVVAAGVPEGAARLSERLPSHESMFHLPGDVPRSEAVRAREEQLRSVAVPSEADLEVVRAQGRLWEAAGELREALDLLEPALKAIDPQLEVHQPDVSNAIDLYRQSRAAVLVRLEDLAWHAPLEGATALNGIIAEARENQRVIAGAVKGFRSFLASEFAFKESF